MIGSQRILRVFAGPAGILRKPAIPTGRPVGVLGTLRPSRRPQPGLCSTTGKRVPERLTERALFLSVTQRCLRHVVTLCKARSVGMQTRSRRVRPRINQLTLGRTKSPRFGRS